MTQSRRQSSSRPQDISQVQGQRMILEDLGEHVEEELVQVGVGFLVLEEQGQLAVVLWLDAVLGLLGLVVEEILCIPNMVCISIYTE